MRRHTKRHARKNPDGSLASQAGSAALATVIAAPIAVALDRSIAGMKKNATELRYTPNQSALLLAGIGLAGGVALHVNGYAPRAGVALLSACAALAAKRAYDARPITQQRQAPDTQTQQRISSLEASPSTTTATPTSTSTQSPAAVTQQQQQQPSTPATPGTDAKSASPSVTPSGAIVRRAGAVYAAQYGQVSRSGEALGAGRFQGYALERPRAISAMSTSDEIQGEQMVPRGVLRPAFIKGGRATDKVESLSPMTGVPRPRRATQMIDPMAGTTIRRSGQIGGDMMGESTGDLDLAAQALSSVADPRAAIVSGNYSSLEAARRQQREQTQARDCSCESPSGARVMRRPQ